MNAADKRRRMIIIIFMYASMALLGVIASMRSTMQPLIKADFNASYAEQSMYTFANSAIGIVASTIGSLCVEKKGAKYTVLMGLILMGGSALTYFVAPSFMFTIVLSMIFRIGWSGFEIGNTPIFSLVFVTKIASMMSLYHAFYGVGSTIGPQVYSVLTTVFGMNWRQIHVVIAVMNAVCYFILLTIKIPAKPFESKEALAETTTVEETSPTITVKEAYKNKTIWLIGIVLGFIGIYEMCPVSWGVFYLQDVAGFNATTETATFISLFYLFQTISRMFLGGIMEKFGYVKALSGCLILEIALHVIAFTFGGNALWLLTVTGLPSGLLWPSVVALNVRIFGRNSGITAGVAMAICPIISSICQITNGIMNTTFGIAIGYMSMSAYAVFGVIFLLILGKKLKKEKYDFV